MKRFKITGAMILFLIGLASVLLQYYSRYQHDLHAQARIMSTGIVNSFAIQSKNPDIETDDYIIQEIHLGDKDGPPMGYVQVYTDGSIVAKTYDFKIQSDVVLDYNKKSKQYEAKSTFKIIPTEKSKVSDVVTSAYNLDVPIVTDIKINRSFVKLIDFDVNPFFVVNSSLLRNGNFSSAVGGGISFINVGRTREDQVANSSYKILGLAVDYDGREFGAMVAPIMINTRKLRLPLLNNTYLAPHIGVRGITLKAGLNLSVSL